ncbi:hypothetical protein C0989_000366 [Termitomyces sp. Mn162]|nr:hypothetical protein C0989_000366 [Termitomyces sp. Mn162]
MFPSPTKSPILQDIALEDMLASLNDKAIASMAFDHSSSFSSLDIKNLTSAPIENIPAPSQDTCAPDGCAATSAEEDFAPARRSHKSLLEEFFTAGGFAPIILLPGPADSKNQDVPSSTPTVSSNESPDPFIQEDVIANTAEKESPQVSSHVTPSVHTPLSKASIPKVSPEGHLSNPALEHCEESFMHIEDIFVEFADELNQPILVIKKWFFAGLKGSWTMSTWNLYQIYFPNHCKEELEHCGLDSGTGTWLTPFISL